MATYEKTKGSIVHIEFYSDDVSRTQAFYEDVFGWEIESHDDEDYVMWRAPNPPVGGIRAREEGDYHPPSTLAYVFVDDLADTRTAITDAGGDLLREEVAVPSIGLFCIYQDPGGVVAAAWQDQYEGDDPPGEGWPAFTDEMNPGSIVHFELYSEDPAATERFHSDVFGWEFEAIDGGQYTIAKPPTPPHGGVMDASDHMLPGVLTYILVTSASAVCEEITAAGGKVDREPFDIDGWGTMALFEAPGGITQAVWENLE